MILPCSPPHRRNRLQHRRCLHLLLLGPFPGRLPVFSTSQRGQAPALIILGPSPGRLFGPTCSPPHGGDRLQHRWCLHLLLLGASPGRIHGPPMFSTSQRGQAPALVVCSPTVLHLGPSPGRIHGPTCSPPHGGDTLLKNAEAESYATLALSR
jgi:hypothetical protein